MVIKWGKHGSFIACTGYPECTVKAPRLRSRVCVTTLRNATTVCRRRKSRNGRNGRLGMRRSWKISTLRIAERRISASQATERLKKIGSSHKADLKKLETDIAKQGKEDLEKLNIRLENLPVRYPNIDKFYQLDLKDMESFGIEPRTSAIRARSPNADASFRAGRSGDMRQLRASHGAEEGPLRTFLACSGYPDCKTTKQLGEAQKRRMFLWTNTVRSAATNW